MKPAVFAPYPRSVLNFGKMPQCKFLKAAKTDRAWANDFTPYFFSNAWLLRGIGVACW